MKRTNSQPLSMPLMLTLILLGSTPAALTLAPQALDSNLLLRPRGYKITYNTPNRVQNSRYSPGSSSPLYTISRTGDLRYNPHNAFSPRTRYRPTGFHGSYRSTTRHGRRYRYTGSNYR